MSLRLTMVLGSVSRQAGGLFQSVRYLSQALARRGLEVRVVGLRDPDTEADLPSWAPLEPIVLDPVGPAVLGYSKELGTVLGGSDVVHQHGIWQAFSRSVTVFARRGPTMVSPRGMLDPWARRNAAWKKRLVWVGWEGANLRHAACLHALTSSEAKAIRAVLPRAAIVTIPNGAPVWTGASRTVDESKNVRTCLFMARLHPKKGLDRLLDQWAALPKALRDGWHLEVAGPDEAGIRAALEARIAHLGLSVQFLGPISGDDKRTALERADAFVLPSHSEGLPMAVLEAWSAGLPVLMTAACNLPEGFAAAAAHEIGDDPAALAAGLLRSDLADMGARGRALVEDNFAWDAIAAHHETVYAWMAGRGPRPREVQDG